MNFQLQVDGLYHQNRIFNFMFKKDIYKRERQFLLHYHPYPEIYFFISGNADFIIEGATYQMAPGDIIIVPPYTLHRPNPEYGKLIERYVLNIYPNFYEKMECEEYEKLFTRLSDFNYKISSKVASRTNIPNVISELKKYTNEFKDMTTPVAKCKICELLHIINSIDFLEKFNTQNSVIQEIIDYIDLHFSSNLTLDELSAIFNYSKNYLSSLFKKNTGLTIVDYILLKRIEKVKQLYSEGNSLSFASLESGFNSYSNFRYNYKKIYGRPFTEFNKM